MARLTVDTLGEFLSLVVTPTNAQEQAQVGALTIDFSPQFRNPHLTNCI